MTKKSEKENKINYLEEWKKERASFLNYKSEESERVEKAIKFSNEKFILGIINILDSIYLAEESLPEELEDNQWANGVLQTKNQILELLKSNGVEEIECLDKEFNPSFHEAIDIIKDDSKSGSVIEEINKGYILHNKVIRPSRVKIAK